MIKMRGIPAALQLLQLEACILDSPEDRLKCPALRLLHKLRLLLTDTEQLLVHVQH